MFGQKAFFMYLTRNTLMRRFSQFFTVVACLAFAITAGCSDPNAEFKPTEENTPQIPVDSSRGEGSSTSEGVQGELENLRQ